VKLPARFEFSQFIDPGFEFVDLVTKLSGLFTLGRRKLILESLQSTHTATVPFQS